MFKWIIENKLAQGPIPSPSELESLKKVFTTIIILTMPHENPLGGKYIELIEGHGFKTIHIPTRESFPPQLFELMKTVLRIEEEINSEGKILVSCKGGLGRSGTVTAAFLVYSGLEVYQAIKEVRRKIPGSLENKGQVSMVEAFSTLVKITTASFLKNYSSLIEKIEDRVEIAHASKTVQFTLELLNNLTIKGINTREVVLGSLTHFHNQTYRRMIIEQLGLSIDQSLLENPLVEFSHELDGLMDGRVVITQYDSHPGLVEITLLCDQDCGSIVEKAVSSRHLLVDLIEKEVRINWGYYLDYV
ncbi:MAG: dual specificity protein phosphatase family protein [Thermosphaera sp.]